jgi:predicted glycosyltransferase
MPGDRGHRPLRLLLYSQHLSGTGHYIRTFEIARALAANHDVTLVEGGRNVPRRSHGVEINRLSLPQIYRATTGLAPVDSGYDIGQIMQQRLRLLLDHVQSSRPDVLLIEHFPFSKHELRDEILPVIEMTRSCNVHARVICSARDIILHSRHDPRPDQHAATVLATLDRYFDMLLVHADPAVCSLDDFIPWIRDAQIPIRHTGYVSETPATPDRYCAELQRLVAKHDEFAIASAGGAGGSGLIAACIRHWNPADIHGIDDGHPLLVFVPLTTQDEQIEELRRLAGKRPIIIKRFTPDFVDYLAASSCSISQAGYNTCANILETHKPALLVPDPAMSDQPARARILADRGLALTLNAGNIDKACFAGSMSTLITSSQPPHGIDLGGAGNTACIVEELFA